ncbi:MAG: cellulase family glycosylhydrolase [Phycisphaerae bacterium]|nr:cellulase family glycosylhydrolase [Phycisphaerae bacterium]
MIRKYLTALLLWTAGSCAAGPIQLHPDNSHYFLWRGKPTLLMGSTEHYGAVLNGDFDYLKYLSTLKADGLNLTRTFSGAYCEAVGNFNITNNTLAPADGKLICPWARSDQDGYAGGGKKFDLTKWNAVYFDRLKDFVQKANEAGVVVELVLFCPFYEDTMWNLSPMNAKNNVNGISTVGREQAYALKDDKLTTIQKEMVRKIVRELKDCENLYYEICNEPYFGGVTLAWQAAIAQAITETEKSLGVQHLIAQNIANHRQKIEKPNPQVSIFNFHYARPPVTVSENWGLNRPIGDDETGFDGSEDKVYRREAWNFLLAGGAIFDNLDYSFSVGKEDGTGKVSAPGGGSPALRKQLRYLKETLEHFDFVKSKPVEGFVTKGLPDKATAYALQRDQWYLAYISGCKGPIEIQFNLLNGKFRIEWINPKDGKPVGSQQIQAHDTAVSVSTPAFEDDLAARISTQ